MEGTSPLDLISTKLAEIRQKIGALQVEEAELEIALRVLERLDVEPAKVSALRRVAKAAPVGAEKPKHGRAPWTDEEQAILREHWRGGKDSARCAELLPGRSESAITFKGYSLRLQHAAPVDLKVNSQPRRVPLGDQRFRENKPAKKPRTFEEQLEAVANGAPIIEHRPIRKPPPDMTLGGVAPQPI